MEVKSFRIAEWNANGLANHKLELTQFLYDNNVDVLLASETHFTDRKVHKNTPVFAVPK
jgi:exonuclease III